MSKRDPEKTESPDQKERHFKITTMISIIAIILAIFAAGFGAFIGVYYQNECKKQTTAKLIYDDIDRMNWTLSHLSQMVVENPDTIPLIFTPIYPESGVYYTSRPDIALLDDRIARNISIFYTDLHYAEIYRKSIVDAYKGNNPMNATSQISIAYSQYYFAITEANEIRSQIIDDLEKTYQISKSSSNRFNRY